ncbi:hypothetical protein Tco_1274396 [Tanacetum coccineum]
MGDEHLDTILATESDEVIKSSVENLVPIPSKSEGIPDSMECVALCNNPTPLEAFKEHSETITNSNHDYSLSDDDSFSSKTDRFADDWLTSYLHRSIIPFMLKIEPELGNLTMDVVGDIFPTREPRVHVPNGLPTHPTLNLDFILSSESLFAYIVWILHPFSNVPVSPPYLLSCGNKDTVFDPGISIYHSFMPGVSHRSGTFMKFYVYPNNLNESPMKILSSTCSPNLID